MKKGQFTWLEVTQINADIVMTLKDPNGDNLFRRDSEQNDQGKEVIGYIANRSGHYRLVITAFNNQTSGEYELNMGERRLPTKADHARAKATSLFEKATQLASLGTEISRFDAVEVFEGARKHWAEAGEHFQRAVTLMGEAAFWYNRGDQERRLELIIEAEPLFAELGEDRIAAGLSHNIANILLRKDLFEGAMAHFEKALNVRSEASLDRASTLQAQAMAYRYIGDYQTAYRLLGEAKTIQDRYGTEESRSAWHDHLAALLMRDGKAEEAIEHFEIALETFELQEYPDRIGTFDRLGQAYAKTDQFELALIQHEKALALLKDTDDVNRSAVLYNQGVTYLGAGAHLKALDNLSKATALFEKQPYNDQQLFSLFQLARVEKTIGKCDLALDHVISALEIMEQQRLTTQILAYREKYMAIRYEPLELMVELVLGPDAYPDTNKQDLWERLDRLRATGLVDTLRSPESATEEDPTQEAVVQRINDLSTQVISSNSSSTKSASMEEMQHLLRRYDQNLRQKLEKKLNKINPGDFGFTQMREMFSNEDNLLLFYAMGVENVYLLTILDDELQSFNLGSRKTIEANVNQYFSLIESPEPTRHRERLEIYGKKLKPLLPEQLLKRSDASRLIIVSDGVLHGLPFAALPHGKQDKALVNFFEICHLPSLASIHEMRKRDRKHTDGIAVFTNPAQPDNLNEVLPGANIEGRFIKDLFGESHFFTGPHASIAQVKSDTVANSRFLHFAVHGYLYKDHGEASALIMAGVDHDGRELDRYLRASTIAQLELSASLVVLAACQSGLGQSIRGEGLVGLQHAFLKSGVARVMASLWFINDEATLKLMTHFYEALVHSKKSPSAALQYAQKRMLHDEDFHAPYYWAAFRVIGDWEAIDGGTWEN